MITNIFTYPADMHAAFHSVPKAQLQSGKDPGCSMDSHIAFEGSEQ